MRVAHSLKIWCSESAEEGGEEEAKEASSSDRSWPDENTGPELRSTRTLGRVERCVLYTVGEVSQRCDEEELMSEMREGLKPGRRRGLLVNGEVRCWRSWAVRSRMTERERALRLDALSMYR